MSRIACDDWYIYGKSLCKSEAARLLQLYLTWGCVFSLQAGLSQQARQFHWDKRKRRYIQLQPGEQLKAGKRMKGGNNGLTPAKKSKEGVGLYKKWSRAHQTKVTPVGQLEDSKAGSISSGLADR